MKIIGSNQYNTKKAQESKKKEDHLSIDFSQIACEVDKQTQNKIEKKQQLFNLPSYSKQKNIS